MKRMALVIVGLLAAVSLFADFLASERPILARWQGTLYLFPNLTRPDGFPADLGAFAETMADGDWYLPPLVPYGPTQTRVGGEVRALRPPSAQHWLGTDRAGCDVFARLVHGARASLGVGLLASLFTALFGLCFGAGAGAARGPVDAVLSRFAETVVSFPPLVLLCALQALTLRPGVTTTAFVIALVSWPHLFRLVRADLLHTRGLDFVVAARAVGVGPVRLLFRHQLPSAWPAVGTAFAFGVPSAILLEASLSYLGIGLPPDLPSWGELLHQAGFGAVRWWLVLFPGLALFFTAAALLILAERVRRALDPRPIARALGPRA